MGELTRKVFEMIGERGEATAAELSRDLDVDVVAVGRILRVLVREGSIELASGLDGQSVKALPDRDRLGRETYVRISRRLIDEITALEAAGHADASNSGLASAIRGQMSERDVCLN